MTDFEAAVEAYREGIRSMVHGDNAPVLELYSRRDDVTLANPLGPPMTGWTNIARESATVAAAFAGGTIEFEDVTRFCNCPRLSRSVRRSAMHAEFRSDRPASIIALLTWP